MGFIVRYALDKARYVPGRKIIIFLSDISMMNKKLRWR